MSDTDRKPTDIDAQQIIFLPRWARLSIAIVLGVLAVSAAGTAVTLLFFPNATEYVTPVMSISQSAAGGFALVLIVLFSERQLSTDRLYKRTDQFLDTLLVESMRRIEVPQAKKNTTMQVDIVARDQNVYGGRKDIFGSSYQLTLNDFKAKMWVGINVKRLSVIYFIKIDADHSIDELKRIFNFTLGGAEKVGYHTNMEPVEIDGEKLISIWSTVFADKAILVDPSEQLFWVQDIAMMTQSICRTALRNGIDIFPNAEPGPL